MNARMLSLVLVAGLASWMAFASDGPLKPMSQQALLARLQADADAPFVLDVRTPEEFVAGHVPGAINIPHDRLAGRLAEVPRDRDVVVYCRSGRRAVMAGEVLAGEGYNRLHHLEGDMIGWADADRPTEKPQDPEACRAALARAEPAPRACYAQ